MVISAGNQAVDDRNASMTSGHHAADAYPLYLCTQRPDAELATAALALTAAS